MPDYESGAFALPTFAIQKQAVDHLEPGEGTTYMGCNVFFVK